MARGPKMADYQPSYNVYFDRDDIEGALGSLEEHGFCVLRKVISLDLVEELKGSIDASLDPQGNLPKAANRYNTTFAEASRPLWKLVEEGPYMKWVRSVHKTSELCLHRSAAILRSPGDSMGQWHTDHRGRIKEPKTANDVLNRFPMPSGNWFYLSGSHPDRSGIAVIENSHRPDWAGPEGFELTPDRHTFHPQGEPETSGYQQMDVPGCIGIVSDPGDLICFAALTYHVNMATNVRRYSCSFAMRPKSIKIDAPWPLPESAKEMTAKLPDHLKTYAEGYTSLDSGWKADEG